MASEWPMIRLENVAAKTANAMSTGPFGSAISSRFFTDHGVPVIRGSNLTEEIGTHLLEDEFVFVDELKAKEFSRSIVRKGDLIFTCWGTIGQVGLISSRCKYSEYVISNKQMKLTPDPEVADSLFLYYVLSSSPTIDHIKGNAIGSSVPGFNLGQLRSVEIRLPPLKTQRRIAEILGTLDDKIELNHQMNETLETMAQALFRSWFVDFDPVRVKARGGDPVAELGLSPEIATLFPDSFGDAKMREIPVGWKATTVSEAFEVNPQRTLKLGAPAIYLDMKNMPTNGHSAIDWWIRPAGSGTRFRNGDTLIARITPCLENGKTAFVDFLKEDEIAWGSTEYIVLRSRTPLALEVSYLLAKDPSFREHIITHMTGSSGRQRVPADAIERFEFCLPSASILDAFSKMVKPLFEQAKHHAMQNRILSKTRDALLPKLLSGDISVAEGGES